MPLVDKITGNIAIDSLSYIDPEYNTQEVQDMVDNLIQNEMQNFVPIDYLADLPLPEMTFGGSKILQGEYKRMMEGIKIPEIDVNRYRMDPPPASQTNDVNAWKAAYNNAQAQLEHQKSRLINIELLETYGSSAWSHCNEDLESNLKYIESKAEEISKNVEEINKKRKRIQIDNKPKLDSLNEKWNELILINLKTENAINELENEIKKRKVE